MTKQSIIHQTACALLAFSVARLFPAAKLNGGSLHELGFSYDFYLEQPILEPEISLIEMEMFRLSKRIQEGAFSKREMMRENGAELFKHLGQPHLAARALEHPDQIIPLLQCDNHYMICPRELLEEELQPGVYKILSVKKIDGCTRFSAVAFKGNDELKKYLKRLQGAASKDHRLVGPALGFFDRLPETGGWFFPPRGAFLRQALLGYSSDGGFKLVVSTENVEDLLIQVFKSKQRSYKELPLKWTERRVRAARGREEAALFSPSSYEEAFSVAFTSHEGALPELISSLQFIIKTINMFAFEHEVILTVPSQNFVDSFGVVEWLKRALVESGLKEVPLEVGSPIDGFAIVVKIADAAGHMWRCSYLGVDALVVKQYHLRYQEADDTLHRPVVIVRSLFGPLERFIALLIEKSEGILPCWLSEESVRLMPVSNKHRSYAEELLKALKKAGVRAAIDLREEPLATRIHLAEKEKVPLVAVLGNQEVTENTIALRRCGGGDVQKGLTWDAFLNEIEKR